MVSEGVWGGFNAKSVHDTQILPFFQCPVLNKNALSGGVQIVYGGVWMGYEGVWGCVHTKYFGKNLYRSC